MPIPRPLRAVLTLAVSLSLTPMLSAQPQPSPAALPQGGTAVYPQDALLNPVLIDDEQVGSYETVAVDHADFEQAVQVTTTRRPGAIWDVQVTFDNPNPIAKGDVLHLRFAARCLESMTGEGFSSVKFEQNTDPWPDSFSTQVSYTQRWAWFDFPIVASQDYAVGSARLTFQMGYDAQTMQLAGVSLTNYGPDFDLDQLPQTKLTYPGAEPDAPWRDAAEQRIDQLRKADLLVRVTDANGNPVPTANVHVDMQRHAFRFGSAVVAHTLAGPRANPTYQHHVETLFNEIVFENDMKWVNHGFGDPDDIEAALQWLEQRGITVRGHVMLWPGWRWLPEELRDLADQPDALRAAVHERVTSVGSTYAGRIVDWDVLNEPFSNHDLMDILGDSIMDDAFHLAKQAAPDARRTINDWGILTNGGYDAAHQDHYFNTIQGLLERGAPLQAIGFQGHFGSTLTAPTRLLEIMDRFAATGLRLKITELDIVMLDEQLRAQYLKDLLTVAFSHPAMDGVILWGFWADRHWKPEAALFTSDWQLKPTAKPGSTSPPRPGGPTNTSKPTIRAKPKPAASSVNTTSPSSTTGPRKPNKPPSRTMA